MTNKNNLNGKYLVTLNDIQTSFNELNIDNKKEIINILNSKKYFPKRKDQYLNSSNIQNNLKDKYLRENDKLKKLDKDKNRIFRQKTMKNEKDNYLYGNNIKYIKPYKCGNVYCFCYINKYPLITIGPQYYYPLILFLLNNIIFFLFNKYIFHKFKILFKVIEILLIIIVNFSHLYTTFINEGIPKRVWFLSNKIINYLIEDENFYNEFNTNKYQICRKCNILIDKSLKITHCDICNLCCEFYDHHCPWIGKCIGRNNLFCFKIFILSNIIFIIYSIIFLFIVLINKYKN